MPGHNGSVDKPRSQLDREFSAVPLYHSLQYTEVLNYLLRFWDSMFAILGDASYQ